MERTIRHRVTARVVPVNSAGEVLLLHGWDPATPDLTFWFSVGGGLEPGETHEQAAAREMHEETGVRIDAAALRQVGCSQAEFDWGDWHLVQDETWFAVRLDDAEVHFRGLEPLEVGTIDEARWWTADALDADGGAVSETLTAMMRRAVEAVLGR